MGRILLLCFHIILIQIICHYNFVQAEETDKKCVDCGEPLYLTPLIEQGQFSEARKQAEVHHEDFHVPSYSGFLNVEKETDSQMFFWYFPSLASPDSPLILWLEGSPRYTILYDIFYENGPFEFINGTVSKREVAWNNDYHLLYIDNPVGTGFSHTKDDLESYNQTGIAKNLYSTLHQFLTLFSELQQKELYIVGASYGAKYAVSLCDLIHRNNQNTSFQMNVQGFALFSPYIDPVNQVNEAIHLYNRGLLDKSEYEEIHALEEEAKTLIRNGKWIEALFRLHVSEEVPAVHDLIRNYTGFSSIFNILRPDEKTDDVVFRKMSILNNYIDTIRKPLHIGPIEMNNIYASPKLIYDRLKSVAPVLSEVLNHYEGIVVTGQLSFTISYPMVNDVLNKLEFSSSDEWRTAKRSLWHMNGKLAGYYKTAGNLTEIMVLDAGHMIAVDQPKRAYQILKTFTSD